MQFYSVSRCSTDIRKLGYLLILGVLGLVVSGGE